VFTDRILYADIPDLYVRITSNSMTTSGAKLMCWTQFTRSNYGPIARKPLNSRVYLTGQFEYTQRENRCKNT